MLGARGDVAVADEAFGVDFEAEVAVVTGDVPMGTMAGDAGRHIRLVMLANDVSLQPDPRRAGEGLRLPAIQACILVLAGRRDSRRAWRCMARCQGPSAADLDAQRQGIPVGRTRAWT